MRVEVKGGVVCDGDLRCREETQSHIGRRHRPPRVSTDGDLPVHGPAESVHPNGGFVETEIPPARRTTQNGRSPPSARRAPGTDSNGRRASYLPTAPGAPDWSAAFGRPDCCRPTDSPTGWGYLRGYCSHTCIQFSFTPNRRSSLPTRNSFCRRCTFPKSGKLVATHIKLIFSEKSRALLG